MRTSINDWLQCCSNDGSCSQRVRRRSYPREYHEAGREHQESAAGRALARLTINTSATDFAPIKQFQLRKFKAERWELFGDLISSEVGE